MPEASYNRSRLFAEHQDVGLAAEAIELARVFADMTFIRAANPDSELLRDWTRYADFNARIRHALDGLLLAYAVTPAADGPLHGFGEAQRLAGQVEAFILASPALECQVFEHPTQGGGPGFVIALSAFASDLMANLSWALPTLYHAYRAGEETPTDRRSLEEFMRRYGPAQDRLRKLDRSVASYLGGWESRDARLRTPISILPTDDDGSPEGAAAFAEAKATHAACQTFLLAHELSHITQNHFSAEAMLPAPPPGSFLAELPEEIRREVEADCAAFTLTMNALIVREGHDPRIPDFSALRKTGLMSRLLRIPGRKGRQEQARRDARMLLDNVNRATEACLSFYAVTELLATVARQRGNEAQAQRFDKVSERKDPVRGYVQWVREGLEQTWGVSMWHPDEALGWRYLDQHIDHLTHTLVPTLGQAPAAAADDVPATFRPGTPPL
ncbi:hypothetical protein [Streptomyces sp. bgisy091]|uniref:hypothetical protein n=1 Tax=Streptomyces sp. bgisy091 TaxID=3413778 RepID=UPI003D742B96